jgi:Tfp pilus assembly protein PilF
MMSTPLNFLIQKAVSYINEQNFKSASLMLRQALKLNPNHAEALRLSAVVAAKSGDDIEALELIERALLIDRRNGVMHSNKGNILLKLGKVHEAIVSYNRAIEYSPKYAEAYGNLGNAYQDLGDYENAQRSYDTAISIDPRNPDFYCHLGNAFLAGGNILSADHSYGRAIELDSRHADSHYFLALSRLSKLDFDRGWSGNEWRWASNGSNSIKIRTAIKEWDGTLMKGNLLVWGEQGIGDQILYASMLSKIKNLADAVTISVDQKLIPIFERSFPNFHVLNKNAPISEENFDAQIPIGSLGQFFRRKVEDFSDLKFPYLLSSDVFTGSYKEDEMFSNKLVCGISWKSSNRVHGKNKSMQLDALIPILSLSEKVNFINLQYGDSKSEIKLLKEHSGITLEEIPDLDLFNDLNSTLSAIEACDIIVTTSNTTAHMAGALGKETLLLLPFSAGKFWYWHDIDGVSLWYPSIRVFKQEMPGDWCPPIDVAKAYLEKRFEI